MPLADHAGFPGLSLLTHRTGVVVLGRTSVVLRLYLVGLAAALGACKLLLQSMSPAIFSFHSEGDKS